MIFDYLGTKNYLKGPLLIPLDKIDLDKDRKNYDDEYLQQEEENKGIFRGGYYVLRKRIIKCSK